MLVDDQLYLLSCIFSTRANVQNVKKLSHRFKNSKDFINAVIVLWPEHDDPMNLRFLLDDTEEVKEDDNDLVISLLNGDSDLISMVELDPEVVANRASNTKHLVDKELGSLLLDYEGKAGWLEQRILYCNESIPEDTLLYEPLWALATPKDEQFKNWIDNLVVPLGAINARHHLCIKIREFLSMEPTEVMQVIDDKGTETTQQEKIDQLMPYLKYKDSDDIYKLFLAEWYSEDRFELKSAVDVTTFGNIFHKVEGSVKQALQSTVYQKTLDIIFAKSGDSLSEVAITGLLDILSSIPAEIKSSEPIAIDSKLLATYFNVLKDYLPTSNVRVLHNISQESESVQRVHFSSICGENMTSHSSGIANMRKFIDEEQSRTDARLRIFNKLDSENKLSVLFESCLNHGQFELLQSFNDENSSESLRATKAKLLEEYFWQFFESGQSGNSNSPGMIKCSKIVKLLQAGSTSKSYANLEMLLTVSNDLSKYAMSLSQNTPFHPSSILNFKEDPFKIIDLILERNPELHRSIDTTSKLIQQIYIALDKPASDIENTDSREYVRLVSIHINHSLANFDFQFALLKSRELLKMGHVSGEFWQSVFQVGKFKDPNWVDNETPTEILFAQMSLLSQLLELCPVDEIEFVTQQWSELEIEIAARDLVHDKYSLDYLNSKNSVFSTIFT
ncbi:Sec39 protein [Maudiozyma humilis]|uniref:Sec39 protein n=1 Tax=Maudiozyma humilis TaxID=51915 RepID=A0AAV5RYR9_MAUHU|nr:Sec39 protein [Kazachstania humilis]